jgi:hypothetical protein
MTTGMARGVAGSMGKLDGFGMANDRKMEKQERGILRGGKN